MLTERLNSLSLANLLLMGAWIVFLHDGSLYQLREAPERPLSALLSLLFTLLITAEILYWSRRKIDRSSKKAIGLFYGVLFLLLLIPVNQLRTEIGITWRIPYGVSTFVRARSAWQLAFMGVIFATPFIWCCTKLADSLPGFTRALAWIVSPAVIVCVANGIWTWQKSPPFQPRTKNVLEASKDTPRVLWILFDELDKRLVFEERPTGIEYPHFDRFVKESVGVRQAFSPGPNTLESIPGLLTGNEVSYALSVYPPDVYLTFKDNRNTLWSAEKNVFSKAEDLGFHTALLGWYHAYCAILGKDIDVCERRSHFRYSGNILENMPIVFRNAIFGKWVVSLFLDGAKALWKESVVLASNPLFDFVFVHLPVPHSPWIFDRSTYHTTLLHPQTPEGYFDNVAYADKIFGRIRAEMENQKVWDKTIIILSTDHSWRGAESYDQKKDARVPFYVKMPDRQTDTVEGPFRTRHTANLVIDLLTQKVRTSSELKNWLLKVSSKD